VQLKIYLSTVNLEMTNEQDLLKAIVKFFGWRSRKIIISLTKFYDLSF
jgi:hypothetical protein